MGNRINIIGMKFGRLTVLKEGHKCSDNQLKWACQCKCGAIKEIRGSSLRKGSTLSCGCLQKERASKAKKTHDYKSHYAEYRSWQGIKDRCYNHNCEAFENYGGRGIKVCDRWLESFENFLLDMGPKPTPEHSLDRWPNNETGHYEPGNCRWGNDYQQSRNKRNNKWVIYKDERMIVKDFGKIIGIRGSKLYWHLSRKTPEQVVEFFKTNKS
jgi:hypothetical protein